MTIFNLKLAAIYFLIMGVSYAIFKVLKQKESR